MLGLNFVITKTWHREVGHLLSGVGSNVITIYLRGPLDKVFVSLWEIL